MTDGREIDKFAETPIYQSFVRDMIGRSNLTHTASGPCTRKKMKCFQSSLVRTTLHNHYYVRGGAQGTGIAARGRV